MIKFKYKTEDSIIYSHIRGGGGDVGGGGV